MAMDFGKLNFAVGFNRTSAFPLDANSYFEEYSAAVTAAAGAAEVGSADSAYYIGQLLIVKDATEGVGLYQINAGKTLTKFGQASSADELASKISALETRCTTIEGKLILATTDGDGLMSKEDFAKLAAIENNAQVNKIEVIQVDGTALSIGNNKNVNIDLAGALAPYAKSADVTTELAKKVDAVEGKGLSTNDYDAAAVAEVAKIKDKADASTVTTLSGKVDKNAEDISTINGKLAGLTGAMHFIGTSTTDPMGAGGATVEGHTTFAAGDVCLFGNKEFVYDGSAWAELGDEGSHLTKTEAAETYLTKTDAGKTYITIAKAGEDIAAAKQAAIDEAAAAVDTKLASYSDTEATKTLIATAKSEAIADAGTAADGKITEALKAYTNTTTLNGLLADKADASALDTANGKIGDNEKAIAAVKTTADAAIPKNANATEGTGVKVTTDANGVVIGFGLLTKDDIPAIDQSQINGLGNTLAGKQDTITFNTAYDASTNKAATMSDVNAAKNALVGSADDASTVDTIGGAKKYAEEKATAALTSAKNYADGILSGDTGVVQRVADLEGKVDVEKVSTAISTAKSEATTAAATDATTKVNAAKSAILGKTDDGTDYVGTVKGAYEAAAAANTLASSKTTMAEIEAKGYAVATEVEAYKTANDTRVKAIEDKEATWDAKQNAITDGSATIASVANGIVTIKAGVAQDKGAIKQGAGSDVVLAKVASTGAAADISVADAAGNLTSVTVEAALAELATMAGGKTITCEKTTPDGVAARYVFKQGGAEIPNAIIDIPKDMVVQSGSVVTNPAGQAAGTYLELVLANATNDKVYINVGDLIEYVTSGSEASDPVQVVVSADHKVTASIRDGSIVAGKLATAIQTQLGQAHEHANKSVLDKITAEQVEAWDSANSTIEGAVDAGIASLDYTDAAVAGQYVSAVSQTNGVIDVVRASFPVASNSAAGMVQADGTTLEIVSGVMSIKQVNVSKLYVASGDTFILNGGGAAE